MNNVEIHERLVNPFWDEQEDIFGWTWLDAMTECVERIFSSIWRVPKSVNYFFQRGRRGLSDQDLTKFDKHLTETILSGLRRMKETRQGSPQTYNPETKEYDHDKERWNYIVEKMIEGFCLIKDCQEEKMFWGGHFTDAAEKETIQENMQRKTPGWRFTTLQEEAKIEEAFNLFSEHYFWLHS